MLFDSFPLVDNAILDVAHGNCRWSRLGFSYDQHPDRHRDRTRRARPRRVGGAGRGRSPRGGPRTRRRPGCWRWRCTGWTCTRSPPEHPAATFPTQRTGGLASALGPGFFDQAPLAGDGTPGVAEYAVEELAAALNLSHAAGLALVSEAVELRHRLPRLWALVRDGRLQAWKARQVARATTQLSADAVAFVDRHLAVTGQDEPAAGAEPGPARGPAAVRPRPGRRRRAARPGPPRRVAGPPGVHRHHPAHRPAGHPGRPRPRRLHHRPGRPDGPARRPPHPGRPPRLRARPAGPPAAGARPGHRHRHRLRDRRRGFRSDQPERLARHPLPARDAGRPRHHHRQQQPGRAARHRLPHPAPGLAATAVRA